MISEQTIPQPSSSCSLLFMPPVNLLIHQEGTVGLLSGLNTYDLSIALPASPLSLCFFPLSLPVVCFVSSQTSAVNTGLLSSSNTNDLTITGIADRVGLRVLEGNGCHYEVSQCSFWQLFMRKKVELLLKTVHLLFT